MSRRDGAVFEVMCSIEPKQRNAINDDMMEAISAAFDDAEKPVCTRRARAVVIRAEGRVFPPGIDLKQLQHARSPTRIIISSPSPRVTRLFSTKIERCSLPVDLCHAGLLPGPWRLNWRWLATFALAAERTKLGLPESRLGIIPDVGGTVRLVNLIGPARAKDLIMTGQEYRSFRRRSIGAWLTPSTQKPSWIRASPTMSQRCRRAAPLAISYAKRVINDIVDNSAWLEHRGLGAGAAFPHATTSAMPCLQCSTRLTR